MHRRLSGAMRIVMLETDNPSVCLRRQLPLHRGAKGVASTHAVLFFRCANFNSNPSVCLRRQLPLHRGAMGVASTHAALFRTRAMDVDFTLAVEGLQTRVPWALQMRVDCAAAGIEPSQLEE